ncbi:helix-turn-helix transcriptional regulator [Dactylosporangium sp. NPDC006015]|uniref:helix-turn-helix transcriptional regulator n=1 Tax=Dactylosporangium sp. NPDC006015 TaxID=3154576 RepID=UPI0033BB9A20
MSGVGERIQALRTGKGLTQRDLAEPNYTAAYVSSVENGHRVPSSDALAHFAARLRVDVTQLTTGRHPGDALSIEIDLLEEVQPQPWYEQLATDPTALDTRRAAAEVVLGRRRLTAGAADDAVAHFERARRLVPPTLAHLRTPAVAGLALCARLQGDPGYAAYLLTGFRDELHRAGLPDPASVLAVHALLALCQHDLGEDAAPAASTALALAGPGAEAVSAFVATARTLAASSHLPEARAALTAAGAAVLESWLADEIAGAFRIRARARLSAGDLAGALADLTAARQRSTGPEALDALVDLAEVHRALGDPATARALLSAADPAIAPEADLVIEPDADALITPGTGAHGGTHSGTGDADLEGHRRDRTGGGGSAGEVRRARAHRVHALLSQDAGDLEAAERHLRAAIAIHRGTGPRRELAQLSLDLADLLTAMRRPDDALAVLADGLTAVDTHAG